MSRKKLMTSIKLILKVVMYLLKQETLTRLLFLTAKAKTPIIASVKDGQLTINDNNSKLDSTSNKHINFFRIKDLVGLSTLNRKSEENKLSITLLKTTIDFFKGWLLSWKSRFNQ